MPLVASAPLFVEPEHRELGEYALSVLARCRYLTRASFLAAMGPHGMPPSLIEGWVKAGVLFQGTVILDPLKPEEVPYLALTRFGARALSAAMGLHVEGRTPAQLRRATQKRGHDVCVGELALAVFTLAKDGFIDLVGVETDDRRLTMSVTHAEPGEAPEQVTLRPDAYLAARSGMGTVGFLVEVDRGTVSLKTMQRRYAGYFAWQRDGGAFRDFGIKGIRVLTVVPTEARLRALHDAGLEANHGKPCGFLLFALQDQLSVCTAEWWLGPVAYGLGTNPPTRVPLLPEREPTLQSAA